MDDWKNTALLVIDVQKGLFEKSIPIYNAEMLLENINHLIDSAHQIGVPVFFIQHSNNTALQEGSDAWLIHPQLQPAACDYIIHKQHPNAFEGTTLGKELGSRQIKSLVITGLVTHGCVKATCIGAHELGYKVILVKDGHSNFHRKAREVIDEWNQKLSQGVVELKAAHEIDLTTSTV
jgi:nicotinamidase-related amidase